MCWRNASDVVSYPNRQQDDVLVQGYEKTRNNCLVLESVSVQQPGRKRLLTRYHQQDTRTHLPVLDCVVTRI